MKDTTEHDTKMISLRLEDGIITELGEDFKKLGILFWILSLNVRGRSTSYMKRLCEVGIMDSSSSEHMQPGGKPMQVILMACFFSEITTKVISQV